MNRLLHLLVIIAAVAAGTSCSRKDEWRKNSGAVWATQYNITYFSDRDLGDSIQEVFRKVEMSLSPFNPQSRISLINRNEDNTTDPMIDRVTAISQEICRESRGAFDPTVSPLVNLWGFGYTATRPTDVSPPPHRLRSIRRSPPQASATAASTTAG